MVEKQAQAEAQRKAHVLQVQVQEEQAQEMQVLQEQVQAQQEQVEAQMEAELLVPTMSRQVSMESVEAEDVPALPLGKKPCKSSALCMSPSSVLYSLSSSSAVMAEMESLTLSDANVSSTSSQCSALDEAFSSSTFSSSITDLSALDDASAPESVAFTSAFFN